MKILFVYGGLGKVGGIETLIMRLAENLHRQNHSVYVLLNEKSDSEIERQVSKSAQIFYTQRLCHYLPNAHDLAEISFDYIHAFAGPSLLLSYLLRSKMRHKPPIIAGVYHGSEYFYPHGRKNYRQKLIEKIFHSLPPENILFMSSSSAKASEELCHRDFAESPIVPLPIVLPSREKLMRTPSRYKIVSIGRLTNFKTYNFHMVDVVRQLNESGRSFEYHVYGDGEDFDNLKKHVELKQAKNYIFLHGSIPYSQMGSVFGDAFLFAGMGTALLEAAAHGVPSLICVESNPDPTCYGFFHESASQNFGEIEAKHPVYGLKDSIQKLAALDAKQYEDISKITAKQVESFSIDRVVRRYIDALQKSKNSEFEISYFQTLRHFLDSMYWRLLIRCGIQDPMHQRYLKTERRIP